MLMAGPCPGDHDFDGLAPAPIVVFPDLPKSVDLDKQEGTSAYRRCSVKFGLISALCLIIVRDALPAVQVRNKKTGIRNDQKPTFSDIR
jgi:hypothetical protein